MQTEFQFPDQFLILEEFGRSFAQDARLRCRYFDDPEGAPPGIVTIGLPQEIYRLAYRTGEMVQAELVFPAGAEIRISADSPGVFSLNGPDQMQERFERLVQERSEPGWMEYPLMYFVGSPQPADLILRAIFRGAKGAGTEMFVSTEELSGRLEHVLASWMLDTYEKPLDILVRRGSDWAAYHAASRCAFESSDWFFEQNDIIRQISREEG